MKRRFYIFSTGILQRQDNSLVYITKKGKEYIPIFQTEIIYIFGSCTLNKTVLQILSEYNIILIFFSYYGRYIGSYLPRQNYIGQITQLQIELFKDKNKVFSYQKEIIYTSIYNMVSVLKFYQKKRLIVFEQTDQLQNINNEIISLDMNNKNKLLILEARAKQVYYSTFNLIIKNSDFKFITRTVNPPKDAINAIMSYGYALLYGVIETSLYCSHLLPHLGIIHSQTKTENSLKYDIADIFKPVLIDRLIFRMINKKQLTINNFINKDNAVYLSKEGAVLFIEEFEETLKSTINITNRKWSYRSITRREIYNIELSLQNKKIYTGYKMRW